MTKELLYFEDLEPHDLKRHDITHTLRREEIDLIANTYDPAPFHLSDEMAAKWGHPSVSAPGVLTEAICIKLLHENLEPIAAIGLAGKELTLPIPFYPDDTVTLWSGLLDKRRSKSKPDRGIARFRFVMKTQNDGCVYDAIHTVLIYCRDKG
jgi:acyl dehydratase